MRGTRRRAILGLLAIGLSAACASPPPPPPPPPQSGASRHAERSAVVRTAVAQVGTPYRYGGSSPEGFDCSGLVVYSYWKAGLVSLPHSAAALDTLSQKISLQDLQPGDLLFFRLGGSKPNHVAIYVGGREFVHAPSAGKRVEKLSFDHVYWGARIKYAGRLLR